MVEVPLSKSTMDQQSKNGSRPTPDAGVSTKHLAFKLEETLAAENANKLDLLCIDGDRKPWEVTIESRDGAVHNLRFLRIWFDLPSAVFFKAVSYMDQFLVRIKVQEKFVKCLTVSCFFVAAAQEGHNINAQQLVKISQSRCSVQDMLRMAGILKQKLKLDGGAQEQPATAADFLNVYCDILEFLTCLRSVDQFLSGVLQRERLLTRLEVLMTEHTCAFYRPSVLALVLVRMEIEREMQRGLENSVQFLQELFNVFAVIAEIQHTCTIVNPDLANCYNDATRILQEYDNQAKTRHAQSLLWRFSSSTHALCNRHRTYHVHLKTIEEQQYQ